MNTRLAVLIAVSITVFICNGAWFGYALISGFFIGCVLDWICRQITSHN